MSHYTCMVIGPNPEKQLAPYSEHIQTEPRVTDEVSEDDKNSMIEYYKNPENGGLDLPFDELYTEKGEDWNNNSWEKHDDVWVEVTTYNPKSKWDWYQLGGRWIGFLKLKEGATGEQGECGMMTEPAKEGYVDATTKGNIDIAGMRKEAADNAAEYYDKVYEVIKDTPQHTSWSEFIKKVEAEEFNFDIARNQYHDQPRIKALNTPEVREIVGYFVDADDFNVTKEEYVQQASNRALSTFAILKDGEWYEKGKMGWWAMVTNEMEQKEWDEQVTKMFDELPDDTLISIYDCHI